MLTDSVLQELRLRGLLSAPQCSTPHLGRLEQMEGCSRRLESPGCFFPHPTSLPPGGMTEDWLQVEQWIGEPTLMGCLHVAWGSSQHGNLKVLERLKWKLWIPRVSVDVSKTETGSFCMM